jgi:hypothetical protein
MKKPHGLSRIVQLYVIGVLLVMGAHARTAEAQTCMGDRYSQATGGHLTCTANDVRIARVTNITDPVTSQPITSCISGQRITFAADFEVDLNAQTRYDIGMYLATDGDSNSDGALTGDCAVGIITPVNAPKTFVNLDPAPDTCGDITGPAGSATNPQIVHMQVTALCLEGADGNLRLPNCTSWRQPGSNAVCTGATDAYPGSPSKCNCDKNFTIPVHVEHPTLIVSKMANPTYLREPGGAVTFTVKVTNPATVVGVNLASLADDAYNDGTHIITYNATSAPTLAAICDKTYLGPGETATCTFTRQIEGNANQSFTDKACVAGNDTNTPPGSVGPVCATASVSIGDVLPTAGVAKSLVGLKCATATYQVKVDNTDAYETLTLSALSDNVFGDITSLHGSVLRTDCAGNTKITAGSSYTCTFDAQFCSAATTPVKTVQDVDTVTATLADDDGNTITPSSNNLTVTVTAQ